MIGIEVSEHLRQIIEFAVAKRASDVFILPKEKEYCVKIHTATGTIQLTNLDCEVATRMISYCKYQSKMTLTDSRRPQLGAMSFQVGKERLRMRLSSVGNFNHMESLVIRIIYNQNEISDPWFFPHQFQTLRNACENRGLMLFSGPTGSGKTTTIYKIINALQTDKIVMTIEDPVEIFEESFLQLEVNNSAKMTYSELLKVGLRQRPDIFVIGEIRDAETAAIAVRAALSGHLVFSTVHAKSPDGAIMRMLDLGVDRQQLLSAITMVAYQRLIPTTSGGVKTLFALQSDFSSEQGMTDWTKTVNKLKREGKISDENQRRFQTG